MGYIVVFQLKVGFNIILRNSREIADNYVIASGFRIDKNSLSSDKNSQKVLSKESTWTHPEKKTARDLKPVLNQIELPFTAIVMCYRSFEDWSSNRYS